MKGSSRGASPRPRLPEPPPRAPTAVAAALHVTRAHLFAGLLLARRPRPQRACKARTCGRNRHLKSHRKGNLGSKQSFCRWFLKHAKEADRSHSLNVSNSCEAGAGSGFTPDCCPRGPWGQGVSCQPLRSCLLPVQEQGWGCLGAEKDRG